jgi:hypothetical protein
MGYFAPNGGSWNDGQSIHQRMMDTGFTYTFETGKYFDSNVIEQKLDFADNPIHVFDRWTCAMSVSKDEHGGWVHLFTLYFKNELDLTMARLIL